MNSARKIVWRLTVRLELVTYVLGVPLGTIFVILVGGYRGERLLFFLVAVFLAVLVSLLFPLLRFVFVLPVYRRAEPETFSGLGVAEQIAVKSRLMRIPAWNILVVLSQWSVGIACASGFLFLFFVPTAWELTALFFVSVLIYPILAVSHFLSTEILNAELLETKAMALTPVPDDAQAILFGLQGRAISTIFAVVWMPLVFLGMLLFGIVKMGLGTDWLGLQLGLGGFFLIAIIIVTGILFTTASRRNVRNLVSIIAHLTAGDLRQQLPMISGDELGRSSRPMNQFIQRLGDVVQIINQEARRLGESSERLRSTTRHEALGLQNLAAMGQQMSASTEELSASVSASAVQAGLQSLAAERANQSLRTLRDSISETNSALHTSRDLAHGLGREASEGSRIITAGLQAMKTMEANSSQIVELVKVMEEIADQVNLLALNASIEAARAGDAGRGFAVVATEVSRLADRSQSSARMIQETVQSTLEGMQSGVRAIGSSAHSFARIEESVQGTLAIIDRIAKMSDAQLEVRAAVESDFKSIHELAGEIQRITFEQDQTMAEIAGAIHKLSETTDFLSTESRQTTDLAADLAGQAGRLTTSVAFFEADEAPS